MSYVRNPIIERELLGILRTKRALAMLFVPAVVCVCLVLLRWPSDAQVDLTDFRSREVFRLFGYGLLTLLLFLVPVYPATSIIREKQQGTLALLLNSPMSSWAIFFGKLVGALGFVFLPLVMSLPAAAACYAMGGIDFRQDVLSLYIVLALVVIQYAALGLLVSVFAESTDSAVRMTFGCLLLLAVLPLGPHQFFQGSTNTLLITISDWLRCVSPIPAVMEILGHGDVGAQGLIRSGGVPQRFMILASIITLVFFVRTASALKQTMLDRTRSQGIITDDRSFGMRAVRRLFFLVDPQRRKMAIGRLINPVMVKEFRSRRFGRLHWLIRLVAGCALVSLGLTYATTTGTLDWGVEAIGGIMVVLQVSLIVLLTPSLAAGLISSEHETGGWTLLRMTPLSTGKIVRGKLISVIWTLLLILFATLPGYGVMIIIKPVLTQQISYVLICLVLTAILALVLSAAVSSFFRRTASATVVAYAILIGLSGGTMLIWLGRDAPFGHTVVQTALMTNPMAAALNIMEVPGFRQYDLLPFSWWFVGGAILVCLAVFSLQTWRLTRPQ